MPSRVANWRLAWLTCLGKVSDVPDPPCGTPGAFGSLSAGIPLVLRVLSGRALIPRFRTGEQELTFRFEEMLGERPFLAEQIKQPSWTAFLAGGFVSLGDSRQLRLQQSYSTLQFSHLCT